MSTGKQNLLHVRLKCVAWEIIQLQYLQIWPLSDRTRTSGGGRVMSFISHSFTLCLSYKYRRGAKRTSGMGHYVMSEIFLVPVMPFASLSAALSPISVTRPWIASHTTFLPLHPCNKSTTLDKITKFYLIPH